MGRQQHARATTTADERWMQRAIALARRGEGRVEPNPMVGCVLVKNDRLVGAGWHRRFGGLHAEREALRAAAASPDGSTAYVSLEPCCHQGKQPPCVDALLEAGVSRVVVGACDPNPQVNGRGLARLRSAGVAVTTGVCAAEAASLIAPFRMLTLHGRPWVIAKWGQSLDGRIATRTRDSKWISDQTMRAHAHRVRARVDAIAVGLRTVIADDPRLTCRVGPIRRTAQRVVLDSRLRIPRASALVTTAREVPTWIFCGSERRGVRNSGLARRRAILERAGCRVVPVRTTKDGRLSVPAILQTLGKAQMTNLIVEGGPTVLGAFQDAQRVDEFHIYLSPMIIGGNEAPGAVGGNGPAYLAQAQRLPEAKLKRVGEGWLCAARTRRTTVDPSNGADGCTQ